MSINKQIIHPPGAPITGSPVSPAVQVDNTLYISGQLGLNSRGELVRGFVPQMRLTLDNLGRILTAAGMDFRNVVKVTVLLSDINNYNTMNTVYTEYFQHNCPARAAYQVAVLPKNALIEIEAVAVTGTFLDSKL